jgi:hypothetical protein
MGNPFSAKALCHKSSTLFLATKRFGDILAVELNLLQRFPEG